MKSKESLPAKYVSKVIKLCTVDWKKLEPLQNSNFKNLSENDYNKLSQSLKENNFIMPFVIWENDGHLYIIDGFHRQVVLKKLDEAGELIPKLIPAVFVECKNKKEAAKFVMIYSSVYAKVDYDGLNEFLELHQLNFESIKTELSLPGIPDLELFNGDINQFFDENSPRNQKEKELLCPYCGKNIYEVDECEQAD